MSEPVDDNRRPNGADHFLPEPSVGRVFRTTRKVRLGDADPSGRLRFDAVARYLQDISTDDSDDLGQLEAQAWVIRRLTLDQMRPAVLHERLTLTTWCSGMGARWAERRVRLDGASGARLDAVMLWVHLDPASGRPTRLPTAFHRAYDEAAGGRQVMARQVHEPVGPHEPGVRIRPWRPRATDLDVLDHVNNSIAAAVAEEILRADGARNVNGSMRLQLEYREPIPSAVVGTGTDRSHHAELLVVERDLPTVTAFSLWSAEGATLHVTGRVGPRPPVGD